MVSSDVVSVVSSFAISLTIYSLTFRNASQHKGFAWPEKHPVLSAPLSAWNAGRAAVLASPRAWTIGCNLIALRLRPYPVPKDASAHSSGYRLKASSVSGECRWSSIFAPSDVALATWRIIFMSASSWLLCRSLTSLCVALHSLPHATTNLLSFCLLKCVTALSAR